MDAEALIAAFKRLPAGDSRQNFLDALVGEFTAYEWRAVQRRLNERTFQRDIIGRLPVELVAHIFAYLEASAPYALQRVSRQWQHILRSPVVLSTGLLSWYGRSLDLQGAGPSKYHSLAKQAHAFRHGHPTKRLTVVVYNEYDFNTATGTLIDDTFIWSSNSPQCRAIHLFNIKTWSLQTLNGDGREQVVRLFASDQIVGFGTASSTCYVWNRRTLEKRQFRLPSSEFVKSVTCRGFTVACAGRLKEHALVYIWDYETRKGTSFTISYESELWGCPSWCSHHVRIITHLQPESRHITVFVNESCHLRPGVSQGKSSARILSCAKFDYEGHLVADLRKLEDAFLPCEPPKHNRLIPVDREGRYRIGKVQFDENSFSFTKARPNSDFPMERSLYYWWKDIYFAIYPGQCVGLDTFVARLGTRNGLAIDYTWDRLATRTNAERESLRIDSLRDDMADLDGPRSEANGNYDSFTWKEEPSCTIHLNDEFIVLVKEGGFEILCFGENPWGHDRCESFFDIGLFKVLIGR